MKNLQINALLGAAEPARMGDRHLEGNSTLALSHFPSDFCQGPAAHQPRNSDHL